MIIWKDIALIIWSALHLKVNLKSLRKCEDKEIETNYSIHFLLIFIKRRKKEQVSEARTFFGFFLWYVCLFLVFMFIFLY